MSVIPELTAKDKSNSRLIMGGDRGGKQGGPVPLPSPICSPRKNFVVDEVSSGTGW